MKKLVLILGVVALTASSCQYMMGRRIRGNGKINTQEHNISSFKNVEVSGAIDLYVAQGETKFVKIETDENLQQYIEVNQQGDRIVIKFREGTNLRPTDKVKAYISSSVYNTIDVSGACNITSQGKIANAENMKLEVSGAGDINMDINAPGIGAEVSGAGTVNLKGETKWLDLILTGAGKAHCFDMLSENTKVDISGAGDADVYASIKLDANISGAGGVSYKGGATSVEQHVSGAGSIKKVD
ncbi:MAG TPA: head GIN domain-containing protein [Chitinophagaceae bacterium]|nr:head GIN domain-containing protein [Chitinophagaceae bacterium]